METQNSNAVPPLDAPLLLGRYRPLALLARGGSSLVYRGTDQTLNRDVAIKVFSAGVDVDQYQDELRLLASLSHHGVVSIVDAGIDDSTPSDHRPFLVMELIHGRTLREAIPEGRLGERLIGEIVYEVAEALDYVHDRGVIHRDISPANVMLTDYGTAASRSRARITDFGIAIDRDYVPNDSGEVTGTVAYLSPEQVRGTALEPSTDIYSLGLVMLECFTRTMAYPGTAIESALARLEHDPTIPDTIPRGWRGLIRDMTALDPRKRPTAAEVAERVRALLRDDS
jgi:eukaryotic-like serine/threonine-protein kinase